MRYLIYFASSFITIAVFYYSLIFALFPTPVTAEYWVRELLVFKRDIAKNFAGQPKIIVASGSSTLFNIDTNVLSEVLKRPTLNLGLMGGLPLDTIFEEVNTVSAAGDLVIMALEPDYYCREANPGYDPWQVRNAIAWNHTFWQSKNFFQKLALIPALGANFPLELIQARLDIIFRPELVAPRLAALDDGQVLRKFSAHPTLPAEPIYSIYNMDGLGNMRNINESRYAGPPQRADEDIKICPQTLKRLADFVVALKSRSINIVFANTPYMTFEGIDLVKVNDSSKRFSTALEHIAPVIDDRTELIFARDLFFDSVMHLNAAGREQRTQRLLARLQATQQFQQSR